MRCTGRAHHGHLKSVTSAMAVAARFFPRFDISESPAEFATDFQGGWGIAAIPHAVDDLGCYVPTVAEGSERE